MSSKMHCLKNLFTASSQGLGTSQGLFNALLVLTECWLNEQMSE